MCANYQNSNQIARNVPLSTSYRSQVATRTEHKTHKLNLAPISIPSYGLNVETLQQETSKNLSAARKIKAKFKPDFEKLREKTKTKNDLCRLFSSIGKRELAAKMRDCSNSFFVTKSDRCIQRTEDVFHCGSRHCPFCAAHRAREKQSKYFEKMTAFAADPKFSNNQWIHLVLTQKHRSRESLLQAVKRIKKSFSTLIGRKTPFWKKFIAGGVYAIEYTLGRDGLWHAHIHAICSRKRFFDVRTFRAVWKDVTGDSVNFKIIPVADLKDGLAEVVKYIGKSSDVSRFNQKHARQMIELESVKMSGVFGKLLTFEMPETKTDDVEHKPTETQTDGDLCACHRLPLKRVKLDVAELIELKRRIYDERRTLSAANRLATGQQTEKLNL